MAKTESFPLLLIKWSLLVTLTGRFPGREENGRIKDTSEQQTEYVILVSPQRRAKRR
jgi:hypothetical protein